MRSRPRSLALRGRAPAPAVVSFRGWGTGYQRLFVVDGEQEGGDAQRPGCHQPRTGVAAEAGPRPRISIPSSPARGRVRCGLEPLHVPFRPEIPSTAPSWPRGPFLRHPPLPPLSAAVTKRSSRTAVLVRPPLPTARGGSHVVSQHPRWLQSRHTAGNRSPYVHPPPLGTAYRRSVGSLTQP